MNLKSFCEKRYTFDCAGMQRPVLELRHKRKRLFSTERFEFEFNLHYCDIRFWNCLLSKSESVKFSLIESVVCPFTGSSVKKYFSLLNQSIFTEIISEIWLIYSNLFLAIWISQISLIISRFWLIQI